MENQVYLDRISKVRKAMRQEGISLFLVGPSSNLFYLGGYAPGGDERLLLLVLPAEGVSPGDPFVLANLLYQDQVKGIPVQDVVLWKDGEDPFALLKREIEKRHWPLGKVALEGQLPAFFSLPIGRQFPGADFSLGASLVDPLRLIKDAAELDLIRRASKLADQALEAAIERGAYWLGKTEAQFWDTLAAELRGRGIKPWDAIVAAGPNGAVPHHLTGDRLIEKGQGLLVDFGGRLEGYNTDCTRTFHFGRPSGEFEQVYRTVLEAHLAAEAAAQPGNRLGDVDQAARSVIERAGYGPYFTHRTGHGLGIDTHEGASVNKGEETLIAPGMVFSIEPGIYLSGRLGVRIENLVAITKDGPEPLHSFPRELSIIE
ncbi:MAG: Xaa-Pro peptidase family protein [Treponema sp.]|jgi:Xaa-Pro dipeptidase|nr:Xaa-Pro peptidase family protein [Treponema sp.]